MKLRLVAGAAAAVAVALAAPAGAVPIWEEAARVYESAMSQYRARHWSQAHGLLERIARQGYDPSRLVKTAQSAR